MSEYFAGVEVYELVTALPSEDVTEATKQALFANRLGFARVGLDLVNQYRDRTQILTAPTPEAELSFWRRYFMCYQSGCEALAGYNGGLIPEAVLEHYERALSSCAFDGFCIYSTRHLMGEEALLFGIRLSKYFKIGRWGTNGNCLAASLN